MLSTQQTFSQSGRFLRAAHQYSSPFPGVFARTQAGLVGHSRCYRAPYFEWHSTVKRPRPRFLSQPDKLRYPLKYKFCIRKHSAARRYSSQIFPGLLRHGAFSPVYRKPVCVPLPEGLPIGKGKASAAAAPYRLSSLGERFLGHAFTWAAASGKTVVPPGLFRQAAGEGKRSAASIFPLHHALL